VAHAWRAPGRVNLIGEHTDYNDGFALPFALDAGCTATVTPRADGVVTAASVQLAERVEVPVADLAPGAGGWSAYVIGAVWALRARGHDLGGVDVVVDSDVPVGAGLSSSAALVCATTTALDDAFGLGLDADELLAVTRSVENDYVGAPTGGMDQLASLRCVADGVLFCDMRSLATETVPLPLAENGLVVLVIDSRAPHAHADGEYRRRREGCERAAARLGVTALRDVTVEELDAALARLDDDEEIRYTRHIVTENERVLRTVERLRAGDLVGIGPLLDASHESMSADYRITIPEIDLAVSVLRDAGAVGARMTGGGFGGCVIALIAPDRVEAATAAVHDALVGGGYAEPAAFTVGHAAAGAHRVSP
jgi:galactokinase